MKNIKSSSTQRGKNGRFVAKNTQPVLKKIVIIGERKTGKTTFVKRVIDEINYSKDVRDENDFVRLDRHGCERLNTSKLYIPTIYPSIYDVRLSNKVFSIVDSPPMSSDNLVSSKMDQSITSSILSDYHNDYTKNNLLTADVILIMTKEEEQESCSSYVDRLLSILEMSYHRDMEEYEYRKTRNKHLSKPEPPRILCIPTSSLEKIKSPATLCFDALYSSNEDLTSSLIKQMPVENPRRRERTPSPSEYSSSYYSKDRRRSSRSRRSFTSSYDSRDHTESRIENDPNPPPSNTEAPSKSRSPNKEPSSDGSKEETLMSLADVIKNWD